MSTPVRYMKPLSLNDRAVIDLVTTRYEGVDGAWVAWDRGDYIELIVPERIRLKLNGQKTVEAEAVSEA